MTHSEIGAELRRLREQRGWTQRELAKRCNLSQGQVANVENAKHASDAAIAEVAKTLGMLYNVSRSLLPVGAQMVPVHLPVADADRWTAVNNLPAADAARIAATVDALLQLDDYQRELLRRQAQLMIELSTTAVTRRDESR